MSVTSQSTLKELVDETGLIKDELVTCRDTLKTNLENKGVDVSSTDKMQGLVEKVKGIEVSPIIKPQISEQFVMDRIEPNSTPPYKRVKYIAGTGVVVSRIRPNCYQFSSKVAIGFMTTDNVFSVFNLNGDLVSSHNDMGKWTEANSDEASVRVDGIDYIAVIGSKTSNKTLPLYYIDKTTGVSSKKADLSLPYDDFAYVRYSRNLIGVVSYDSNYYPHFQIFTKLGVRITTLHGSGSGKFVFLNDEYVLFVKKTSDYWGSAECVRISDGKITELSNGNISTNYLSEPIYAKQIEEEFFIQHGGYTYKIDSSFSSLTNLNPRFPIDLNYVFLNDYIYLTGLYCMLFPKTLLFYHEKLLHYDITNGYIYIYDPGVNRIGQYKFDMFSK